MGTVEARRPRTPMGRAVEVWPPDWPGVEEEPTLPPPHPASEREIRAISASIGSLRFVLISFKVSKANPDFEFAGSRSLESWLIILCLLIAPTPFQLPS